MRDDEERWEERPASNRVTKADKMFVSLGLLLGLSVIFHLQGIHVIRATVLCHFEILQLGTLRFVAVRGNAMLGFWGQDTKDTDQRIYVSLLEYGRAISTGII